jgi:predicted nucleotidyltransferase
MRSSLYEQAVSVSEHLATRVPGIDGVCLYGSVARGDEHEGSDIDLLVLGRSPEMTPSWLRQQLPTYLRDAHVNFAYHTARSLDAYLHRWSRFGAHMRHEGKILFDPNGDLKLAFEEEIPVSTLEELQAQLQHLANYDDLGRFGGHFLLPLAHMYSIGRSVVFALLAEHEVLEFQQERAMSLLEYELPEARSEIQFVTRLRPFQERVSHRRQDSLPFTPTGSKAEHEAAGARNAIRQLIGYSRSADALAD